MHYYVIMLVIAATTSMAWSDVDLGTNGGKKFYSKLHVSTPENANKVKIVKVKTEPTEIISRIVIKDLLRGKSGGATVVSGGIGSNHVTVKLKKHMIKKGYKFMIEMYAQPIASVKHESTTVRFKIRVRDRVTSVAPNVRRGMRRNNVDSNRKHIDEEKTTLKPLKIKKYKYRTIKPLIIKETTTERKISSLRRKHYKKKIPIQHTTESEEQLTPQSPFIIKRRSRVKVNNNKDIGKQRKRFNITKGAKRKTTTEATTDNYEIFDDYIKLGEELKHMSLDNYKPPEEEITAVIEKHFDDDNEYKYQLFTNEEDELHSPDDITSRSKSQNRLQNKSVYFRRKKITQPRRDERYDFIPNVHRVSKALRNQHRTSTSRNKADRRGAPSAKRYFEPVSISNRAVGKTIKLMTKYYPPMKRFTAVEKRTYESTTKPLNVKKIYWKYIDSTEAVNKASAELTNHLKANKIEPKKKTIRNLSKSIYLRLRQKLLESDKGEAKQTDSNNKPVASPLDSQDENTIHSCCQ